MLVLAFLLGVVSWSHAVPMSKIGEHMQDMETQKAKKEKELKNLEDLEKVVADQIAEAKAEMAQNMLSTMEKVGRTKTTPDGLVTTGGGIMHSPSQHWKLDVNRLRKEYESAGIYKPEEIDTIIEFHKSYVQNQGFTAGIAEQLAKVAEATAQQRTIQKYISRKKQEIQELENAIQGSSGVGNDGGGGGSGGGSGGGY
jgi:hypothetical protein